jgi:hypothetical protein
MIRHPFARTIRHFATRPCEPVTAQLFALVLALGATGMSTARAQTQGTSAASVDPSTVAAARALAIEGVKLAQDGQCGEAIDKLERAEQLFHGPIVLAQLGQCYVQVGRLVEGSEALRAVLREPLPDDASDAHKRAHAGARATLDATKDKIATLTIRVDVVNGVEPQVTIDDKPVPVALLGAARPTDPGEHTVAAAAPGYVTAQRKVALEPGESETVELSLEIDPNAAQANASTATDAAETAAAAAQVTAAAAATPPADSADPGQSTSGNRWPAYIAWGVSAVALGAGVGFGLVAIDQNNALEEACPNHQCPRSQSAKLDAAQTNGTISTVSYCVAAGAAVVGGVLFFLMGASDDAAAATSARASEPRARFGVGLGSAELAIDF